MFLHSLIGFQPPCKRLLIANDSLSFQLCDPGGVSFRTPAYLLHWAVVPNIYSQLAAGRGRDCERGRKLLRSGLVYKGCHLPLAHLSICSEKRIGKIHSSSCWDYLCYAYLDAFMLHRAGALNGQYRFYVFHTLLELSTAESTLWWAVASSEGALWQKILQYLLPHKQLQVLDIWEDQ